MLRFFKVDRVRVAELWKIDRGSGLMEACL